MSVAAVILAAGAGSRFESGTHKLRAQINGVAVVELAIRSAVEAGLDDVLVVTGAADLGDIIERYPSVTEVHNDDWTDGQAISMQCALHALNESTTRVVVGLGDQPGVLPATWRAVANDLADITIATYDGVRGNPVGLNRAVWALLPIDGDEGARKTIKLHPELVHELPCKGSSADIDTVEDLRQWN